MAACKDTQILHLYNELIGTLANFYYATRTERVAEEGRRAIWARKSFVRSCAKGTNSRDINRLYRGGSIDEVENILYEETRQMYEELFTLEGLAIIDERVRNRVT